MASVRAAALADDTTGALEIGAHFAAARIRSERFDSHLVVDRIEDLYVQLIQERQA